MRPVNHLQRFCERGLLRDSMHSIALFAACCAAAAAPAAAFAPAGAALPASRARAVPRVSSRRRIPSPKLIALKVRREPAPACTQRAAAGGLEAEEGTIDGYCRPIRLLREPRCVRAARAGAWLLHARSGRPFRNRRSVARRRELVCTCGARFAAALCGEAALGFGVLVCSKRDR